MIDTVSLNTVNRAPSPTGRPNPGDLIMNNSMLRPNRAAVPRSRRGIPRGLCALLGTTLLLSSLLTLFVPARAGAVPHFARRIGRNCTYCHTLFPKLNETGRVFLANGFRFEDEETWERAKDMKTIPVSFEVELEGIYNNTAASGVRTESSDMKVEEVEVMAGGAFGKTGRLTVFGVLAVEQSDSSGTAVYESAIDDAFIQINDLLGPTGAGRLNLRAGQSHLVLPFLGGHQRFIHNSYHAESTLGVLSGTQRLIELNGMALTPDDESLIPTHRYSIGISREDIFDNDRFRGYYATYSFTIRETFSFGAIYRGGKEKFGTGDIFYEKQGAAVEADLGPAVLTGGFFLSDREGRDSLKNYMVEVLYLPWAKVSVGARYDVVKKSDKEEARATSLMARYNIISNAYAMLEYRGLSDDDLVTGSNEDEKKLRLIMAVLF